MSSWRSGTIKQYKSYLERWEQFCFGNNVSVFEPGIGKVIEFLTELFHTGIGYSAINTARSALSSIILLPGGRPVGEHPLICRFLKGVFELRPALPKYTEIWDVGIVLRYLKTLYPPQDITLKQLTLKTTTLLCLLTGQRSHTIHKFDTQFIQKLPNMYRVTVREKLKHTKPGRHQEPFEYLSYEPDKALCIYEHLSEYIERTKPLRDCSKLLISYIRPHKAVSKDTVARWLKVTLGLSGIDTEKFTAHSYRAASTSSNTAAGLSLTEILKTAGWSNAQTFVKYYNKPVESVNYGSKLLERSEI